MSTLESTPIPMVRMTPAMPGSVSVAPVKPMQAEKDDEVEEQREVGIDARAFVVDEHEDHHGEHAGNRRYNALMNAGRAKRGSDGVRLQELDRCR